MPQVSKKSYFTSEHYSTGNSYSQYNIFYAYVTGAFTNLTLYKPTDVPSAANDVKLNVYLFSPEPDTYLYFGGRNIQKITGNGWVSIPTDVRSCYTIEANGYSRDHENGFFIKGVKSSESTIPYLEYSVIEPSLSGLKVTGNDVTGQIVVDWNSLDSTSWKLEVIQNGIVKVTKTGTTEKSYTFNPLDINFVGDVTFKITCTGYGLSVTDECAVSLSAPKPTVSTVQASNLELDKPIVITANRTNVDRWEVQAIQNSTVVCSKKGTGDISATFNVEDIKSTGDTIFRVIGYNTWYSTTADKNVTLTAPPISVSDFSVTGTNIDEKISCSASGVNVYNWNVQAIQNGVVKATKTGTGNTINCEFNGGEIRLSGETEFKLTYSNTWESKSTSQNVTLSKVEPLIIALEPNGVTANKDNIITVSWTANNQQKFELIVDGNNYSGTTSQRVNIPIGTIKSLGQKTISLTITYISSWGEVRKHSKTVTFIASGTPRKPILDDYSYYDVALPTFTFESPDQYNQYQMQVLDSSNEVIDDSGLISGHDGAYTCQTTLENETVYKVRVRVRTPYGYWSAWATKPFTTAFIMAEKPSISIVVSKNSIVINSFTKYTQPFDYCDIYRRTENSKWVRIAHNLDNNISFTDRYVGKELYYYKVSSVSTSGGVNDSEILTGEIDINNFNFVDIEDIENVFEFFGNPEVEITDVFESVSNEYMGVFAPIYEDGEHNYRVGRCSFVCEKSLYDKFKAMISKAKVIMYRDCRGEKIYCKVHGNITRPKYEENWVTISFEFTEVPFIEKDLFIGYGNTSNIFWDGTYKWDGSIYWDGDSVPETQIYSAYGNQKLTFQDGEYQWVPKEVISE